MCCDHVSRMCALCGVLVKLLTGPCSTCRESRYESDTRDYPWINPLIIVVSVLYSLATQRDPLCGPTVKLFNRPAPCADFGNCHCHHHRQCRCSHPLNCHRLSLSLSLSLFPLRSAWRWVIRCGAADCRSFGPCAWHRDSHVVGRCM